MSGLLTTPNYPEGTGIQTNDTQLLTLTTVVSMQDRKKVGGGTERKGKKRREQVWGEGMVWT